MEQEWFFLWDNAPVYTTDIIQDWLTTHGVQVFHHLPYSRNWHRQTSIFFQRMKDELTVVILDQSSLKMKFERSL
jgi:hypothetical protein